MTDNVNHPSHYADKEIEVIDYIRDTLGADEFVGYCIGNVLKYTSRWRKKGGLEDLEKAKVYLEWGIQKQNETEGRNGADTDAYREVVGCPSPEDIPWRTKRCRFEHGKFVDGCKIREEKGCQNCNWYLTDKEVEVRGL